MMPIFTNYSVRLVKEKAVRYDISRRIVQPEDAFIIAKEILHLDEMAEEVLAILTLNTKKEVIGMFEVSRGSLKASVVHPREIFKRAFLVNADSIIVLHCHPSGSIVPSTEDIKVTKKLFDAGKILGVEVIDHLIIGDSYCSFKKQKYI